MRTLLTFTLLSVACVSAAPTAWESGDGASTASSPGLEPDLRQAQFFARTQGSSWQMDLKAESFAVDVRLGLQAIRTHLAITMKNPGDSQVEAVMRLPIPPGAAVTRAVLWVGENPMEGAFVARERARAVYRSITERRRDPALIVWSGPEWIDVTVFPVEANATRKLELEWTEPVGTDKESNTIWYRIPLLSHEGGQITHPDSLTVDGLPAVRQGPRWLALPASRMTGTAAVARKPGNPFGYAFSPAKRREDSQSAAPARIVIAAETSRAMAPEDRRRQSQVLNRLLAALPTSTELDLLAVDWRVRMLAEATSPARLREKLDVLDSIPSAGALDLQHALFAASERARLRHASRIVFLGHGSHAFSGDATAVPLQHMQAAGQMLIAIGADRANAPILDVAALTGGESVAWSKAGEVARVLAAIARGPASLTLENADAFFPLETVTGQTRWLARFVGPAPAGVALGNERDLEALWTRAHVAGTANRAADQGERHRVLTPLTSILVLETTADYARWGIPEPKKPDDARENGILGVLRDMADSHFELNAGSDRTLGNNANPSRARARVGMAGKAGAEGVLETRGAGGDGYGTTLGLDNFATFERKDDTAIALDRLAASRAREPHVLSGVITVRGALDKEVIRRVVRLHLNEVKYCHDSELVRNPDLEGRISVQFVIAASGEVISSVLQSSTMVNARVEKCVVNAVRRWSFPKPRGRGVVMVSYPFNFISGNPGHPAVDRETVEAITVLRSSWPACINMLREHGDLPTRVAKIAHTLGAPKETRPSLLAWWLVENYLRSGTTPSPFEAYLVAAGLLREAGSIDDAVRILSEAAPFKPDLVATELRRWDQVEDAERVMAIAVR